MSARRNEISAGWRCVRNVAKFNLSLVVVITIRSGVLAFVGLTVAVAISAEPRRDVATVGDTVGIAIVLAIIGYVVTITIFADSVGDITTVSTKFSL